MVLRLLPVVAVGLVHTRLSQRNRGGGGERDALVCRPEDHVVLQLGVCDGCSVEAAELRESATRVEQPGVEKVGAVPTRLEREVAEAEHVALDAELEELLLEGCDRHLAHLFYRVRARPCALVGTRREGILADEMRALREAGMD